MAGAPVDIAARQSRLSSIAEATPLTMFQSLVNLGDGRVLGRNLAKFWGNDADANGIRESLQTLQLRAKRARAAGMSPAARALRSDVVRRAASHGGTLRCAEARRVAYRNVDKSYASHRLKLTWLIARRLQDSAAVVVASLSIAPKKPRLLERGITKPVTAGSGAGDCDACTWRR